MNRYRVKTSVRRFLVSSVLGSNDSNALLTSFIWGMGGGAMVMLLKLWS